MSIGFFKKMKKKTEKKKPADKKPRKPPARKRDTISAAETKWREVIAAYNAMEPPKVWYKAYHQVYGGNTKAAESSVSDLLRNPKFKAMLEESLKRIEEKSEITNEMIAQKLWALSNFDLRKIASDKGDYKDVHELDDDIARVATGFDIETTITGEGKEQKAFAKRRYRFGERHAPALTLAKIRGMFFDNETKEQTIINIYPDPRVKKSD